MHTTYSLTSVLIRNIQDENNIHANLIITYSLIQSHKKTQEKISQQRIYIRIKKVKFQNVFSLFFISSTASGRPNSCILSKHTVRRRQTNSEILCPTPHNATEEIIPLLLTYKIQRIYTASLQILATTLMAVFPGP